ncbi:MAG: SDR family NAD(P)-dependent oxidoreductase [Pseudomonadota bacterium]
MSEFAGKTAVISGGAEGIGLSIAEALAEQGMNLVLADINEQSLAAAAARLEAAGAAVLTVPLDVADEAQWQTVADQAVARFGAVHMLVNNAGVGGEGGPLEQQSAQGWRWALDVNLMGVVFGAQTMLPCIRATGEGGWIINVASMAGHIGLPHGGGYTATKFAVVGLSEGWASELAPEGIHVSVLCPGFVRTRIHESQRNRPERYQRDTTAAAEAGPLELQIKQFVENGMAVELVGRRVVEALQARELYIFTHTEGMRDAVQQRFAAIDAAFERVSDSQVLPANV